MHWYVLRSINCSVLHSELMLYYLIINPFCLFPVLFLQVAQQSLAAAHVRSKDIDALLNPLNHPMVKSLMSK